jgi:uncharacterized protein
MGNSNMNRRQLMIFSAATLAARLAHGQPPLQVDGAAASSSEPNQDAPEDLALKLEDWRPNSIYRVPVTEVKMAKYPVIDMHNHGVKTAEQTREIVSAMDQTGVERATIFIDTGNPDIFSQARAIYSGYPGRFDLWCHFDLTGVNSPGFGPGAVKALEQCHRMGAQGIGELHDKGKGLDVSVGTEPKSWNAPESAAAGPHPDDPRMDALWERCAQLGMPISIHVTDPIWTYLPMDSHNDGYMTAFHWRLDNKPGLLGHDALIENLERTAQKHPKTIFIACHFLNLSYDLTRLGEILDRNPNLNADIAARMAEVSTIPRFTKQFMQKYQDRLVFGTDFTYTPGELRSSFRTLETSDEHFYYEDYIDYFWPMYGLEIPDPVLKKVYRENALRIIQQARDNAA